MKRLFLFLFPFALGCAVPLDAQSFFGSLDYSLRGSIFVFPEDNGIASSPMPILPSLGGSASYALNDLFALELSLDLYGTFYDYNYDLGRVVPASLEDRSSFVIGTLWGLQPVFRFRPWGKNITIRGYGGPSFDLRICLLATGLDADEEIKHFNKTVGDASEDIFSYFWGDGRWFFPVAGVGMDFVFFESMTLGFDLRAWFPVWRLWTGEKLPPIEGYRFGAGFRVTF
jgi:hypothetical protein